MNIRLLPVSLLATLIVSGCGQKDPAAPKAMESAAAPAAAKAAPAPMAAAPRVIEITANDTMKFSVTSIEAKAGETIKIVLTNAVGCWAVVPVPDFLGRSHFGVRCTR